MYLTIDLQDHKGISHSNDGITIDDMATVYLLKDKIHSLYSIKNERQELFYNETKLIHGTLQEYGIKNEDTIIKHRFLKNYAAFLVYIEFLRKNRVEYFQKKNANRALKIIDLLKEDGFFNVYPRLEIEQIELISKIAHIFDADIENIKKAIEIYFNSSNLYQITYTDKCGGVQKGIVCHLSKEGTTHTYFVKMPWNRPSNSCNIVDLRELFVYQLLHLMGIGPLVSLLPYVHRSPVGLYIATLEVPGFKKLKDDEKNEIQLSLIREIFDLNDLHSRNYGEDDQGNLFVVDFRILHVVKKSKKMWKQFMCEWSIEKRRSAKKIVHDWDLPTKIVEADKMIIGNDITKQLKCNHNKYQDYQNAIRENVKKLIQEFNSLK